MAAAGSLSLSHYAVLDSDRDTPLAELRRRYHQLCLRWHPDKQQQPSSNQAVAPHPNPSDELINEQTDRDHRSHQTHQTQDQQQQQQQQDQQQQQHIRRLNEAWRVLSDPALRRLYDAQLAGELHNDGLVHSNPQLRVGSNLTCRL